MQNGAQSQLNKVASDFPREQKDPTVHGEIASILSASQILLLHSEKTGRCISLWPESKQMRKMERSILTTNPLWAAGIHIPCVLTVCVCVVCILLSVNQEYTTLGMALLYFGCACGPGADGLVDGSANSAVHVLLLQLQGCTGEPPQCILPWSGWWLWQQEEINVLSGCSSSCRLANELLPSLSLSFLPTSANKTSS